MSLFVVDVSAGIKWFVPEVHADAAKRLQDPSHELHIPTFFDVEFANILWKKLGRHELTRAETDPMLARLPLLPATRHAEAPRPPAAFDLADKARRTVYVRTDNASLTPEGVSSATASPCRLSAGTDSSRVVRCWLVVQQLVGPALEQAAVQVRGQPPAPGRRRRRWP
jgi:predicted nucleic acid-binding protein